ncbi:hypothetical protein LS72_002955 [Helicobacter apodemus]|uniref:Lipopolysaccharide heptosyltransferase family protein n=1 Tax=Helicobacter apodemus TaxID=135569 RepID=A0A4U8UF52_9HELI|nr:hypothetical protein [Helicobacter apodemus]TLE16412.1 hypothetical protein LS72_002955 [Helicobacter apodemus]
MFLRNLVQRREIPLKIAVYLPCAGVGDAMVNLKSLYALKFLYPQAILSLVVKFDTAKNLFRNVDFIDEIIDYVEALQNQIRVFDVVLLVMQHDNLRAIQEVKAISAKYHLTTFSQGLLKKGILFISGIKRVINPYWKQNRAFMEGGLNLVRSIHKKHFDKEILRIDYSQVLLKRGEKNIVFVDEVLEGLGAKKYLKIIGINPFCITLKTLSNFSFPTWLGITENLAKAFPNYLFIVMDYPKSGAKFLGFSQGNIKIFKNNEDLLNLVEFISRLDCLLSPDTGNVHIADYLRIPTLEIIRESAKRRWQGGGWGGVCECVVLPKGWQEKEGEFAKIFLQRVKDFLIQNLT